MVFLLKIPEYLQVEIEVESMDKNGAFIGWMYLPALEGQKGPARNLSELLLEEGFASVHFTAERTKCYQQLLNAEERAKKAGKRVSTKVLRSLLDINF